MREALAVWHRIVGMDATLTKAWCNLGFFAEIAENSGLAIEYYAAALKTDPACMEAVSGLSLALWNKGRLVEAAAVLDRKVQLKSDPERLRNLQRARFKLQVEQRVGRDERVLGRCLIEELDERLFGRPLEALPRSQAAPPQGRATT